MDAVPLPAGWPKAQGCQPSGQEAWPGVVTPGEDEHGPRDPYQDQEFHRMNPPIFAPGSNALSG
jgi:hypothetical protein